MVIALHEHMITQRAWDPRQKQQTEALKRQPVSQQSIAAELEKLKVLRDNGDLSQDEYQSLKNKLIAKFD